MTISIPLWKLYYSQLQNPTIIDHLVYRLHCINHKGWLNCLIYRLEHWQFGDCEDRKKLIQSVPFDGKFKTLDDEPNTAICLLKTKPFETYTIKIEGGVKLSGADEHILFAQHDGQQDWHCINELEVGDWVYTKDGWRAVTKITKGGKEYMMDVALV